MPAIKKERIKDQMLKTAARLWNVPDNEIETSFDPLVMLIMEACAAELEKIGNQLNTTHTRLLDKLADMLIPEAELGPKPASAIAHGTPVETVGSVDTATRFYITQQVVQTGGSAQKMDLFFTPVGQFSLYKAKLNYVFAGNKLYKLHGNGPRELVYSAGEGNSYSNEIWLVITPDKALSSLQGLTLFTDLRSHSEAGAFYNSLASAKASINDADAGLEAGYFNQEQFDLNPEAMLLAGNDYSRKTNRKIAGIYQHHFTHFNTIGPVQQLAGSVPAAIQSRLPQQVAQQLATEPMIYLKIELDRPFYQDVLDGITFSINAFPVINRKLNAQNYRTDAWVNIVPIPVEGGFLDLDSINTITGGKYKFRISAEGQNMEEGEAMVRSSGIGKTNSREVREIIGSLMEAIRDESAYFSEVSNDFILARLREISQILTRLEDQMAGARDQHAAHHYVLLRPKVAGETIAINYWTTNGHLANQVKAGAFLTPFNHTLLNTKDAWLLTNAAGGKASVTENEKKLLLRQQLSANGKIISAEDIKLLCFQLFGDKLKTVSVKKGVQVGLGKNEGFIRTVDVIMTLSGEANDTMESELNYLKQELEYTLQHQASPAVTFRIMMS